MTKDDGLFGYRRQLFAEAARTSVSAACRTSYIDPGSPWQNPYVESFGSRVRDELRAVEQFSCLAEAKVLIEDWREDYNHHRPHSALGMKPPARFARAWRVAAPYLHQDDTHRLSQQVDP
jgi:transposase InsO family protein